MHLARDMFEENEEIILGGFQETKDKTAFNFLIYSPKYDPSYQS
jgi:hypothetical protein